MDRATAMCPECGQVVKQWNLTCSTLFACECGWTDQVMKPGFGESDTSASAIGFANVTIAPEFDPDVLAYTAEVAYTVDTTGAITATANDPTMPTPVVLDAAGDVVNASAGMALEEGSNSLSVVVGVGVARTTYTFTITKEVAPSEVDYTPTGTVSAILPETVTFDTDAFTVPAGITAFTFLDGETEMSAAFADDTWTIEEVVAE